MKQPVASHFYALSLLLTNQCLAAAEVDAPPPPMYPALSNSSLAYSPTLQSSSSASVSSAIAATVKRCEYGMMHIIYQPMFKALASVAVAPEIRPKAVGRCIGPFMGQPTITFFNLSPPLAAPQCCDACMCSSYHVSTSTTQCACNFVCTMPLVVPFGYDIAFSFQLFMHVMSNGVPNDCSVILCLRRAYVMIMSCILCFN